MKARFLLDRDPACAQAAQSVHGGLTAVHDPEALRHAMLGRKDLFIAGAVEDKCWVPGLARVSAEIWCLSPPCQPYSTTSAGKRLFTADGRAILHVLSAEALQPKCLMFSQEQGFHAHPRFAFIRSVWERAGYKCVWQGTVDLADFAPSSRKRFLAVLLWHDLVPNPLPPSRRPILGPRPSLGDFACVVQLPDELLYPCKLSPQLLELYMCPALLPKSRHGFAMQTAPACRLRSLQDRMGCIMASYHYQHELPRSTLEHAGLLATLLDLPGEEPRFASGLEVAMMHCSVRPLFLPGCDRTQMRFLSSVRPRHPHAPSAGWF